MKRLIFVVVSIVMLAIGTVGCSKSGGGDVGLVKNGYMDIDKSITVGQAFDGYKYFTKKEWKAYKTEQGRRMVEFNGEFNINVPDSTQFTKDNIASSTIKLLFLINSDNTFEIVGGEQKNKKKNGENIDIMMDSNTIMQMGMNSFIIPIYKNMNVN